MSEQIRITVTNTDGRKKYIWTYTGKNLWDVLTTNGFDTGGICGGTHICNKCKLKVQGQVSVMSEKEKEKLLPEEIKTGMRLACYCIVNGPAEVFFENNQGDLAKPLKHFWGNNLEKDETVKIRQIFIPGLDKNAPLPIYQRIKEVLPDCLIDITPSNLNELQTLDRPGRPSIELQAVIIDENHVKYIGKKHEKAYGIALDIGTTSLFAALVDLENGETAAVSSTSNMQRIYGADVISRIGYCRENSEGLEKLHQVLINGINIMIDDLMEKAGTKSRQIYRLTAVGNPVMLHFLAGISVDGFAEAPYTGLFSDELSIKGLSLGLRVNQDAAMILLPQIGGFVGADTIACLLTLENQANSCYLMIDIGTNGEVVLSNHGDMWAASAAAGPAFEGAGITSGTRACNGSIERFFINEDGIIEFTVIGQDVVKGICGSAIIDLTACLLKAGYINENGVITEKAADQFKIINNQRGRELILYDGENILKGKPVVINQEDIRQVQLAKAAVRTAIDILLAKAKVSYEDIENIYLAGAFGNFLSPENSVAIGMLPPVNTGIIKNIGNAAGEGAIMALLSAQKRAEAQMYKEKVKYVELALYPGFQDKFIENLNFKLNE